MKEFWTNINFIADWWIRFWEAFVQVMNRTLEVMVQGFQNGIIVFGRTLFWITVMISSPLWVGPYLIGRSIVKNCQSRKRDLYG